MSLKKVPKKDFEKVISEKNTYDKPSQDLINGFIFARTEIDQLNSMKRTEGWKLLDTKIREELHSRIEELVADDSKVQTLIALLSTTDTKKRARTLEQEIDKFLPEE